MVKSFYVIRIDFNGSGADNIAYDKVELERAIREYRISHFDGFISVKQILLNKPMDKNDIEDSFFDGFIENYTETPIIHPLLCYGITRHGKHELMTNSIAVPTEFYHYYKDELIYTANNIGDVIKSIEKHSGDKINEMLKMQLMFNF